MGQVCVSHPAQTGSSTSKMPVWPRLPEGDTATADHTVSGLKICVCCADLFHIWFLLVASRAKMPPMQINKKGSVAMVSTPKPAKKTFGTTSKGANIARANEKKPRTLTAGAGQVVVSPAAKLVAAKASEKVPRPAEISPPVASAPDTSTASPPSAAKLANANALKKKDLIDQVLAKTGAKKKLVKDVIEATLSVLGDALSKGAMLNLPPFGKAKVSRPQVAGTGNAMTVKVRRTTGGGQGGVKARQALADTEE